MNQRLPLRAAIVSFLIPIIRLAIRHVSVSDGVTVQAFDPEHACLMGITATLGKSAMPVPPGVGAAAVRVI